MFILMVASITVQADDSDAVEIVRDGADLAVELDVRPDRDTTDTAIVASSVGDANVDSAVVICRAFDANGQRIGIAKMQVPARGLRYLRASDITNGQDYVGQVRCTARPHTVAVTAYLVAPSGITDLKSRQHSHRGVSHTLVPVTASF